MTPTRRYGCVWEPSGWPFQKSVVFGAVEIKEIDKKRRRKD